MQMEQSYLILKKTEEKSQVVTIIPQRSSVLLISPALTSSWQAFPHLFSLGIARNGPEIRTTYLAFIYMKAQENFGLAEETRQEI